MPHRRPRAGRIRASLCHRLSGQGPERHGGGSHLQLPGLGQEASRWAGRGPALSTVSGKASPPAPHLVPCGRAQGPPGLSGSADRLTCRNTKVRWKWKSRRWAWGAEPGLSSPATLFPCWCGLWGDRGQCSLQVQPPLALGGIQEVQGSSPRAEVSKLDASLLC